MFTLSIGHWVSSLQGLQEGRDSLAKHPLASDPILCDQQPRSENGLFSLARSISLARSTTLLTLWGKIIFTGAMTTSTSFSQPAV